MCVCLSPWPETAPKPPPAPPNGRRIQVWHGNTALMRPNTWRRRRCVRVSWLRFAGGCASLSRWRIRPPVGRQPQGPGRGLTSTFRGQSFLTRWILAGAAGTGGLHSRVPRSAVRHPSVTRCTAGRRVCRLKNALTVRAPVPRRQRLWEQILAARIMAGS